MPLEQIPTMIKQALKTGIDTSYVLIDSCFTPPPFIKKIEEFCVRWDIEVFLKQPIRYLNCKESQGLSYKNMTNHISTVFKRYKIRFWQNHCSHYSRTIGGMFYELCDEIANID